jgi:phage gpG-like protein
MARGPSYVEVDIHVNVRSDEAQDRLEGMLDRTKNMKPVLKWGVEKLERAFSENFTMMGLLSAKAMLKGAWEPLDPVYGAWKATRFPGAPPLVQTGGLFRSIANISSSPGSRLDDQSAVLSVDSKIAKFHQYGTENMPARPIVFIPRDFDREIGKKAGQYIKQGSRVT